MILIIWGGIKIITKFGDELFISFKLIDRSGGRRLGEKVIGGLGGGRGLIWARSGVAGAGEWL